MHWAFVAGRMIVGTYYLYNGVNHFVQFDNMSAHLVSKGIPLASLAVALSGLLLLVAAVTLLLGWHPKLGVAALVLFFLPVTFMMHPFWKATDPMVRLADVINFGKNLALMGSALMLLAIPEPWPVSLDARLRLRTPRTA
jgi:putative oxidoreductase